MANGNIELSARNKKHFGTTNFVISARNIQLQINTDTKKFLEIKIINKT